MASSRAEALADQFEKALGELIQTVEACPDDQWGKVCGDEGWTVAATARHVGFQWELERKILDGAAGITPVYQCTWDDVNTLNEKHAQEHSNASKAAVAALLRSGGPEMGAYVRGLSDEQLDNAPPFPLADGAKVPTQALIEGGVLIDHITAHLKSISAVA